MSKKLFPAMPASFPPHPETFEEYIDFATDEAVEYDFFAQVTIEQRAAIRAALQSAYEAGYSQLWGEPQ